MNIKIAELLPLATSHKPTLRVVYAALSKAYSIDKEKTIQTLLYIRDKNNWAWRRDFTRICLVWIKNNDEETFNKIITSFIMIGRWDDSFFCEEIINDHILSIIKNHLELDNTLLKKWLPKENQHPALARLIAKGIGLTMKEYRLLTKKWDWPFVNTLFKPIDSYRVYL